ncbi:MAG: hypothetical protein P4L46_07160 [Fimbriimonas sp.]|nr:hypothetical protein [Fimbriimonas sp.]
MKKLLSISAVLAVFACATTSAFADTPGDSGVSVRIGAVYPTQVDTRNATSNVWFAGGVDYKVTSLNTSFGTGNLSVSVDYMGKGSFESVPVLLNYTSGKTAYWSIGAGGSFTQFVQDDGNTNNKFRFAYSAALGYNFKGGEIPTFIEVRYFGNDQPRVAGVGVYIGARF